MRMLEILEDMGRQRPDGLIIRGRFLRQGCSDHGLCAMFRNPYDHLPHGHPHGEACDHHQQDNQAYPFRPHLFLQRYQRGADQIILFHALILKETTA